MRTPVGVEEFEDCCACRRASPAQKQKTVVETALNLNSYTVYPIPAPPLSPSNLLKSHRPWLALYTLAAARTFLAFSVKDPLDATTCNNILKRAWCASCEGSSLAFRDEELSELWVQLKMAVSTHQNARNHELGVRRQQHLTVLVLQVPIYEALRHGEEWNKNSCGRRKRRPMKHEQLQRKPLCFPGPYGAQHQRDISV